MYVIFSVKTQNMQTARKPLCTCRETDY